MNIHDVPTSLFEKRKFLVSDSAESVLCQTSKYIQSQYEKIEKLKLAQMFCSEDLVDTAPSDWNSLIKLSLFPWVEAEEELDTALSLIMLGYYKNSYDSLRRSLDLLVTGAYFIQEGIELDEAKNWTNSQRNTPNYGHSIDYLIRENEVFALCDSNCRFKEYATSLYYELSGYIHVRGRNKSKKGNSSYCNDGIYLLMFDEKYCQRSLDFFIKTVGLVSLICTLANPVVLLELDLFNKFGLNGPMSGFLEVQQAKRLQNLIPAEFAKFIDHLKGSNEKILSFAQWFDSFPDITEDDIKQQVKDFDQIISEMSGKK